MTPELLIVGHVACDHIAGDVRLGGAASFAAQAAAHLGVRTAVVTAAPADFDLLATLERQPGVELVRLPAPSPTTFELDYSGPVRRVRLLARAPDIRPADIPDPLRRAPLAYVAPVCGECGRELIESLSSRVMVGAQGWLRRVGDDGLVEPALSPEAADPPSLFGAVFSELDHPDAETIARRFATRARVVALTRGARGAELLVDGATLSVPPEPAEEVDPTGAGDVFGLVLGLAVHRGLPPREAGRLAADAAARVVEGPGIGRLAEFCASEGWQRVLAA